MIFLTCLKMKSAENVFEFLNCQHENIKLTVEKENHNFFSFLDILTKSTRNRSSKSVYRKKISIGLFTQASTFTTMSYKIGLVRYLIHRAFRIVHTFYLITNEKRSKFYCRKTCTLNGIKLRLFWKNNSLQSTVVQLLKNEKHYIMPHHVLDIFLM